MLNRHKHFTEVDDIATQFDLFNLVSDAIREVSLRLMMHNVCIYYSYYSYACVLCACVWVYHMYSSVHACTWMYV